MIEPVFAKIAALEEDYCRVWEEYCNIESPTRHKEGVDAAAKLLIDRARVRGWLVETVPCEKAGDAVCITMNPQAKEAALCVSGHMDTVHAVGSFGTPAVKIEGDKIYGPGVCDCKGGIASALLAMEALQNCGFEKRPIKLILQSDEEVGSATSEKRTVKFMAKEGEGAVAFFNCESYGITGEKVVVARKGIIRYTFSINGKAAHASVCYNGASAIAEAAHKILELEKYKEEQKKSELSFFNN